MAIDYQRLKNRHFPPVIRRYDGAEAARIARGFGAGATPQCQEDDALYLQGHAILPMAVVALADGEFWQQRPDTGIDWRRIVHAEEGITLHQPLPPAGLVVVNQHIEEIFDRGIERGAVMQQKQVLSNAQGTPLATIDVTTVLKGDGGFGGKPYVATRAAIPQDRGPDMTITLSTPADDEHAIFRLSTELAVGAGLPPGKSMMRGLGCFGLAGRGVLKLVCDNDANCLRKMSVRYAGPMLTGETMLIELWKTEPGKAMFRMSGVERGSLVLDNGQVAFST
jgi:hypothetical protein